MRRREQDGMGGSDDNNQEAMRKLASSYIFDADLPPLLTAMLRQASLPHIPRVAINLQPQSQPEPGREQYATDRQPLYPNGAILFVRSQRC